jgi:hypothetical protein
VKVGAATLVGLIGVSAYFPWGEPVVGLALSVCFVLILASATPRAGLAAGAALFVPVVVSASAAALLNPVDGAYGVQTLLVAAACVSLPSVLERLFPASSPYWVPLALIASSLVAVALAFVDAEFIRPAGLSVALLAAAVASTRGTSAAWWSVGAGLGVLISLATLSLTPLAAISAGLVASRGKIRWTVPIAISLAALVLVVRADSLMSRFALDQIAFRLWAAYPLTGPGLGAFPRLASFYSTPDELAAATNAHNLLLQAVLDYGPVAAAAVLIGVARALRTAAELRTAAPALIGGLVAFLVAGLSESVINGTALSMGHVWSVASPLPFVLIGCALKDRGLPHSSA